MNTDDFLVMPNWVVHQRYDDDLFEVQIDINAQLLSSKRCRHRVRCYTGQVPTTWLYGLPPVPKILYKVDIGQFRGSTFSWWKRIFPWYKDGGFIP